MKKFPIIIFMAFFGFFLLNVNLPAEQRAIRVIVTTPEGKEIPLYRNSYALVVGNGNYTRGWDPLPGAIRDVKDVAKALERNGFKVTLKANLTKDAFNKIFWKFCHEYGRNKDNRLLFYYAGHGHTQEMATGEDLGYLVMVDAPVPEKDPMGFSLASVDMQTMVTQAKMIKARHVLFMFDSCFSGSILNLRERVVPQSVSESIKLPVRQFITAGRANEPVPDHSIFKQAFLDLLEGRDREPIPDGFITGEELGLYLKNKVPEYNPTQHPQYGKIKDIRLDKGDFIFALKRPSRPSTQISAAPSLPAEPSHMEDYDKLIRERKATKRKWVQWQARMQEDFAKTERCCQSPELMPLEKAQVWASFLSSYRADNLYSKKDDELREKAQKRQRQWKEGKVPEIGRDWNFIAYSNGIVRDTRTGLEWIAGRDRNTSWYQAKKWVESLNIGGGGWRLPIVDELRTLGTRKITPLLKTTGRWVWAAETRDPSSACAFHLSVRDVGWLVRDDSNHIRVFAVRSRRQ